MVVDAYPVRSIATTLNPRLASSSVPSSLPGSSTDLSLRAVPNHPGRSGECLLIASPPVTGFIIFGRLATSNQRHEAESGSLSLRLAGLLPRFPPDSSTRSDSATCRTGNLHDEHLSVHKISQVGLVFQSSKKGDRHGQTPFPRMELGESPLTRAAEKAVCPPFPGELKAADPAPQFDHSLDLAYAHIPKHHRGETVVQLQADRPRLRSRRIACVLRRPVPIQLHPNLRPCATRYPGCSSRSPSGNRPRHP